MLKWLTTSFWDFIASRILRNRVVLLITLTLFTIFMAFQWKNMRFTYTEANLLPDHHEVNIQYNSFLEKFGEEGNLIVIGFKDSTFFTPKNIKLWENFIGEIKKDKAVELSLSIEDLRVLQKDTSEQSFKLVPFINNEKISESYLKEKEQEFFNNLPFYEGMLFNKESGAIRFAIYIDKKIVNTSARKDFVIKYLNDDRIEAFEKASGIDLKISGMPYIRTLNSQSIIDEIGLFVGAALLITSLLFFFFFRSFRATLISMLIVIIGVMWSFGTLGLLNYEITVLTAIIPPLIIVIGIPNCIFLINKYQQEIKKHGNKAKSLQRVISKVGNATLMTNLTTAAGFATFIITDSELLKEFGIVASLNILFLFFLCLIIIPIIYSYMPLPKEKHLAHLGKNYINSFVKWIENTIRKHPIAIYISAIALLVFGIIGIYQIKISGSIIEDMPKKAGFFQDIVFYEKEFDGVMPLEIMIDTKKPKRALKSATLKRINELQETIEEIPELSKPVSVVNLVKYAKQSFYNGNPEYYELPTKQEETFILSYIKNSTKKGNENMLKSYVDSTGQYARVTTFMRDIGTDKMKKIEDRLQEKINTLFPSEQYTVTMTGKAYVFEKGTHYLVKNLVLSLLFAIFLISLLMAYLFRSFKMIIISLLPNILPLIITAGVMGFFGIPIKPSTILVFSIAFGISVDDTIHFLAKYRQELKANNWKIKKSVFNTVKEAGISMFYTSVVLFFGFSVFTLSSFGGTVALGSLVAATLLFAMLANLILLPALLLTLEKTIANEQEFIEPKIDILAEDKEEEEENKNE
ncbi:efflux RND transporter permease subunit [Flavobacterium sediminilitoris]|uniref:Efflux RND transporter permease subunit n=1 Tax=Flavobacterium sediminilitoris TaxID=2024526 RepID=A0ABY4HQM5_9FLAO|nr:MULTISPECIES: efflux RND transporter permease subunit [Flavobacterium]UOX35187.1 efflux RND transporter permease subunit [Flavobacterium sediminilitoris]